MKKGLKTFIQLDEWIVAAFTREMEAIRELLLVIKEAIEAEAQLINHLELKCDKFDINFELHTLSPVPTPRPESPVEKVGNLISKAVGYDYFTCLQLLNLALQFKEIAPSGLIRSKDFIESLIRYTTFSAGMSLVPEVFSSYDAQTFQQICITLDPFETGFVSWRKYLAIQSKVLPIASISTLVKLKDDFQKCKSYHEGKVSHPFKTLGDNRRL